MFLPVLNSFFERKFIFWVCQEDAVVQEMAPSGLSDGNIVERILTFLRINLSVSLGQRVSASKSLQTFLDAKPKFILIWCIAVSFCCSVLERKIFC